MFLACNSDQSPWLCADCGQIHCGRYIKGHAKDHANDKNHIFSINCYSLETYCYACDETITNVELLPGKIFKTLNKIHSSKDDLSSGNNYQAFKGKESTRRSSTDRMASVMLDGLDDKKTKLRRRCRGRFVKKTDSPSEELDSSENSDTLKKRRLTFNSENSSDNDNNGNSDLSFTGSEKKETTRSSPIQEVNKCDDVSENYGGPKNCDALLNSVGTRASKLKEYNTQGIKEEAQNEVIKTGNPGFAGLRNLGNSCFMNAVLQSLR